MDEEEAGIERDGGVENNVSDSNIFFYVMLTLVFLLSVLAIVIAIVAYVKATGQLIGPAGPQGPEGEIPVAQLFEQPAFYISALNYTIGNDPLTQPRFLVFTGQPPDPNVTIKVTLPPGNLYSGKIFRIYNIKAIAGIELIQPNGQSPVPQAFNPILPGYFAFIISDGSNWVINSSTIEITFGTGSS